jgi:hypothetical protein
MNEMKPVERKQPNLAAMLRFLLVASGPVERQEGETTLLKAGGRTASFSPAIVAEAIRRGLAIAEGRHLAATPEARNHLRRLLAGGEAPFAGQHRDLVQAPHVRDGVRETVTVNRLESPLAALARLRDRSGAAFLPESAIAAGERLHVDFTRGGLQPRMTMNWEPRIATRQKGEAGGTRELADTTLAACARVERAIEAIGPELSGVALDVCCFMKGLEAVERERQWPVRSAKLMLRAALMALARHYAPPAVNRSRSHAWGAEGFRPEIGGG